jgi:predicted O-linked N-acetylglucosamine transferase (SPINDLY family)
LLTAIGLPELIAADPAAYEAMAIAMAREPEKLRQVREKLAAHRASAPLFDTKRLCRNIEAAYQMMWEKHQKHEAPRGFQVGTRS